MPWNASGRKMNVYSMPSSHGKSWICLTNMSKLLAPMYAAHSWEMQEKAFGSAWQPPIFWISPGMVGMKAGKTTPEELL